MEQYLWNPAKLRKFQTPIVDWSILRYQPATAWIEWRVHVLWPTNEAKSINLKSLSFYCIDIVYLTEVTSHHRIVNELIGMILHLNILLAQTIAHSNRIVCITNEWIKSGIKSKMWWATQMKVGNSFEGYDIHDTNMSMGNIIIYDHSH